MSDTQKNKRIVFVTGASRGIGNAIARRFLCDGHPVAAGFCAHPQGAQKLATEFPDALAVRVDAGDRESIRQALQQTRERFNGSAAILVNNGAIAQEKPFLEISDQDWDRMLGTNLRGPFALAQEVLPGMLERRLGAHYQSGFHRRPVGRHEPGSLCRGKGRINQPHPFTGKTLFPCRHHIQCGVSGTGSY